MSNCAICNKEGASNSILNAWNIEMLICKECTQAECRNCYFGSCCNEKMNWAECSLHKLTTRPYQVCKCWKKNKDAEDK